MRDITSSYTRCRWHGSGEMYRMKQQLDLTHQLCSSRLRNSLVHYHTHCPAQWDMQYRMLRWRRCTMCHIVLRLRSGLQN